MPMRLFSHLQELVVWPEEVRSLAADQVVERVSRVRRLIDFDGTIAEKGTMEPRLSLRGRPLAETLAEEPYLVQTFNPVMALRFFELNPLLPPPVMVIVAPTRLDEAAASLPEGGKDFRDLGLCGKEIIDDLDAEAILAPDCEVVAP
jgi:hypothetical protein